jgi:hypothetical protein
MHAVFLGGSFSEILQLLIRNMKLLKKIKHLLHPYNYIPINILDNVAINSHIHTPDKEDDSCGLNYDSF